MSSINNSVRGWPNPSLGRSSHVSQVYYAQTMAALTRGKDCRSPALDKDEWDALEALAAGLPVDDLPKFEVWLDGTAKFFATVSGHYDFRPWLEDAFRIARRLSLDCEPPELSCPLDGNQSSVELEIVRNRIRSLVAVSPPAPTGTERSEGGMPPASSVADRPPSTAGAEPKGGRRAHPEKRIGRPPVSAPASDQKLFDDWKASDLPLKDFARARGLAHSEVEAACHRHRTRMGRAKSKRPPRRA